MNKQPENPARESREAKQREAGYRVALKGIIRSAVVDNETPTDDLEAVIKGLARIAPAVVARGVETWFEQAAKAWVRGSNSGNQAVMDAENDNCDRLRDRAEQIVKLWDVEIDYPGLYPSFRYSNATYYDCLGLLRAISSTQ